MLSVQRTQLWHNNNHKNEYFIYHEHIYFNFVRFFKESVVRYGKPFMTNLPTGEAALQSFQMNNVYFDELQHKIAYIIPKVKTQPV